MTTNENRLSDLSDELRDLPLPSLSVDDMIMVLIDADEWTAGYAAWYDAMMGEGEKSHLMIIGRDLLDFAADSSTQYTALRRALEIADEVEALDNDDQEYSGRHGL